jgi:cytochrome c
MDSFEFNKVAGAVLAALLLAFGGGTVADIIGGSGHGGDHHAKPGYVLPVTASKGGAAPEAAPVEFSYAVIAPLMKTATAENGAEVFKRCTACHTPQKGGKPGTGPNLWGIVGRAVASSADFPRYSAAMKGHKGTWTIQDLAKYVHDPRGTIPGNQMAFAGVKSNEELADLLAYLNSLSDSPKPLPN